jgi:acetylornithine deacetylase
VSQLSSVEERALAAVDPAAIVGELTELLAIPSVGGADAEADIQQVLAERLDRLGMDVDLWGMDLPALAATPGVPGVEVERGEAWGLVGTRPGASERPALVLQGHVDVVPAGDRRSGGWTRSARPSSALGCTAAAPAT